jgi:hypothetical protein
VTSDGHTGTKNTKVNEGGSGHFTLILAALEDSAGAVEFVIHATSSSQYSFGLQPLQFLDRAGLSRYRGNCVFFGAECFYRVMATLEAPRFRQGSRIFEVQGVHTAFKQVVDQFGRLFDLEQERDRILDGMRSATRDAPVFGEVIRVSPESSEEPDWTGDVAFPELIELERQSAEIAAGIEALREYLPLLYGTGEELELAVAAALSFLGLSVERTEAGFTADLLAKSPDEQHAFGIEVTGINGPIKKDSPKLTQVLDFERIKEHGEKTILLANTFRNDPITERPVGESFTPQVIDFLGRHDVLLMTTWDLYQLVGQVLAGSDSDSIVERLASETGVFSVG